MLGVCFNFNFVGSALTYRPYMTSPGVDDLTRCRWKNPGQVPTEWSISGCTFLRAVGSNVLVLRQQLPFGNGKNQLQRFFRNESEVATKHLACFKPFLSKRLSCFSFKILSRVIGLNYIPNLKVQRSNVGTYHRKH